MGAMNRINRPEPWRRRLYLPAYSVADAARYAGIRPQTVANWYYGPGPAGPVLPGKQSGAPLSYLQLVEVAFVATFRRLGVSLETIRRARQYLAQTFRSEYPFAELRLQTQGRHVLMDLREIQRDAEIGRMIVADSAGQIAWQQLIGDRFTEFDYERDLAIRWHVRGRQSPIVIDPRVFFGAPTVSGVPTWAIGGRVLAGESIEDIKEDYGIGEDEILEAVAFEGVEKAA